MAARHRRALLSDLVISDLMIPLNPGKNFGSSDTGYHRMATAKTVLAYVQAWHDLIDGTNERSFDDCSRIPRDFVLAFF